MTILVGQDVHRLPFCFGNKSAGSCFIWWIDSCWII